MWDLDRRSGRRADRPPLAFWLTEEEGQMGQVKAHLSATSRRGSTVHCHRLKPSRVATCQIIRLCSFPVLFSTSIKEIFPCRTPRMSQDIRSCKEKKSQKDKVLLLKGNCRSHFWNSQGFCWRLSPGLPVRRAGQAYLTLFIVSHFHQGSRSWEGKLMGNFVTLFRLMVSS